MLGLRDIPGVVDVDPPPGDGGAGRKEKREGSKTEAEEVADVVEAVEGGLLPRLTRFVRG